MRNFISENDIEQAILDKLRAKPFEYDVIVCDADPSKREALPDGTGRASKRECVLPDILLSSLKQINPTVEDQYLEQIVKDLRRDFTGTDMTATNYKLYQQLRNGIKITVRRNGKEDFDFVKLIDFDRPGNNSFTAVSQMWIQGRVYYRRPDILIFVNGLPLVFIELKNSVIKVEEAYNKNLLDYRRDIPNLFAFNQICALSNGIQTKLGAFNATFDYFFEWLKVKDEKESLDRELLADPDSVEDSSVRYFVDGLLDKARLIDYIENFILFENQSVKIIAKNHQYLGVNNLMKSVKNRKELNGKLGVFWHTQGSGKSYSMVMFARKVRRKIEGNFSFLIITDREDLDTQIHKNFVRTEVIGTKEECQPRNSRQLREFLKTNKSFIFTLIHKFRYDKGKKYPVLSERDDIIVLVDEAHRTQYKDLAENMRIALPNANYIAFTGTPLLGSKRLTNQWFGNYVSEYNFAQSVEDGSTVPLYYSRRVPEVGLENDFLDDDIVDIIEDENLNEDETRLLENSSSRILEVIKREDRLDKIAQDIAHHFPRRGFLGKGMVVSVDKYTAVKMYDKVQHYWKIERQKIVQERNAAKTKEERDRLKNILNYMDSVEMAVIISEEQDEGEKFSKQGLDITEHRRKMNEISPEGLDIEDRFKLDYDPLQLVFVCAMWLTGFDVKNLSTLYLDKPMKGHTLMQAIARTNRVYPGKACGIIVDYVNVFKYMQKALSQYATGNDGTEFPAKDIDKLIGYIDATIAEADEFLLSLGIDISTIVENNNVLDRLDMLRSAYDTIIANDDDKEKFKVILNTLVNLYDASKPEVFEKNWENDKFAALVYLHGLFRHTIDDEKVARARVRMAKVLDGSVSANSSLEDDAEYVIHRTKVIDLSKIDVDELRKEIKVAQYKAIEIDDLKDYIKKALQQMLNKNCTRSKFSQRYKNIIDRYNAGGSENEDYYEQLIKLIEELQQENERANTEGLTEEELEIYDLLAAGKKLSQKEEQKVKLSAKNLFKKLTESRNELLVVDWYKDDQTRETVRSAVAVSLNEDLPDSYDKVSFDSKINLLMNHFVDMAVQGYGWIGEVA
ncbi:type I restriction endonuclease subunit R [Ruminococcus difficilis]|uniref:Type I restriction enzyme endonuclease subunit n=1 Tax=Ruminococcus difficilis TaxID=2763069 RepID=A0A934U0D5_9FIRM|nr:type I restriction endonuclease subunit R [Ruminococcus difficilis]MBK6088288.1 type I restriction endonuclease subunit R [Ruminococcus difficilis]